MGTFLHRTTKRLLNSIPPNELPEPLANYISEPDMSGVEGVPAIYWIITGDIVSEMSPAEKAIVLQAVLDAGRDSAIQEIDELEGTLRQIVKMNVDELNILRALHSLPPRTLAQVRTQLRNGYGT